MSFQQQWCTQFSFVSLIKADTMATMQNNLSPKQQKRLDYLLEQAELFSHFVGNSPKQAAKRNKMAHEKKKK